MERVISTLNGRPTGIPVFEPPSGGSPYFGWLDDNGQPTTVKVESIAALFPDPKRPGSFTVALSNGGVLILTAEATERLLKRLGWTPGKMIQKVSA